MSLIFRQKRIGPFRRRDEPVMSVGGRVVVSTAIKPSGSGFPAATALRRNLGKVGTERRDLTVT